MKYMNQSTIWLAQPGNLSLTIFGTGSGGDPHLRACVGR